MRLHGLGKQKDSPATRVSLTLMWTKRRKTIDYGDPSRRLTNLPPRMQALILNSALLLLPTAKSLVTPLQANPLGRDSPSSRTSHFESVYMENFQLSWTRSPVVNREMSPGRGESHHM